MYNCSQMFENAALTLAPPHEREIRKGLKVLLPGEKSWDEDE
jgi:hypothetical protein